jgi:hypothetical protein
VQPGAPFAQSLLKNTLVCVWAGDPTPENMEHFGRELEQLSARYPSGIMMFSVVGDSCGMPSAAAREVMKRQFESMRGRLLYATVAFEKTGIGGALSRAILSTLLTITRRPFEMSIHFSREDAARWLAKKPDAPSSELLLQLCSSLARRLEA